MSKKTGESKSIKSTMLVRIRNADGTFKLVRIGKLKSKGEK